MTKKNRPKFSRKAEKSERERLVVASLTGFLIACVVSAVLMLVTPLLLLMTNDPDSLTTLFSYVIVAISLFFAGVIAVRMSDTQLSASVLAGVMYTVFAYVMHLVFTAKSQSTSLISLLFLLYPVVSLLGGYVGRKRDKKCKRKFRKY